MPATPFFTWVSISVPCLGHWYVPHLERVVIREVLAKSTACDGQCVDRGPGTVRHPLFARGADERGREHQGGDSDDEDGEWEGKPPFAGRQAHWLDPGGQVPEIYVL